MITKDLEPLVLSSIYLSFFLRVIDLTRKRFEYFYFIFFYFLFDFSPGTSLVQVAGLKRP